MKYYDFYLDTAYCLQNCSSDFVLKLYFVCVESRTLETGDFDFGYESCYQVLCNCLQNCSSDFVLKIFVFKFCYQSCFGQIKKRRRTQNCFQLLQTKGPDVCQCHYFLSIFIVDFAINFVFDTDYQNI